ncbi:3-oxo-5-alpha-steroid 4-dehydrogenase-like protein [Lineolata rhizophorae]|uniref:3-oxo-5-alpha-steroid 4-dehydrogenase-like protein n=1 Tax=Lineolata rhizophorae TaxID=578093 RepID=A0A6A6PBD5_9PEZI|nr:3-oxo-5-alpha-steroid 4-dehydrogenase-like protein [Lineolata rhizophorae]
MTPPPAHLNWLLPSRQTWALLTYCWQFFPLLTTIQWLVDWYPQGKTSVNSRFNLPGSWGWAAMEIPSLVIMSYLILILPRENGIENLPWQNWVMATMFIIHYLNRAVLSPLFLNPSMSPLHVIVYIAGLLFNVSNSISLGGWLAAYGPVTPEQWSKRSTGVLVASASVWAAGLASNIYHDDVLRDIRRHAARKQKARSDNGDTEKKSIAKVYEMPEKGLFSVILYPHFVSEWFEWLGFWAFAGWGCSPARTYLLNEIATMLPRALQGKRWYVKKFGREKVGNRGAVLPGL